MSAIKINTDILLEGMAPLSSIVKEKGMIPILECVHIEIKDNQIKFTGNNTEIGCITSVDFVCEEEILACINFMLFNTMLKSLKTQEIDMTFNLNEIEIKHSKGSFKLPKFQSKDFVFLNPGEKVLKANISGYALKSSLKVANKFILDSELEPMTNVLLSIKNDKTIIRSTNKSTLFEEEIEGSGDEVELLISPVSSIALTTLLSDDSIDFYYDDKKVFIEDGLKQITIIQQNGKFPVAMFDKIISSIDRGLNLTISKSELNTSLKRTSTLSDKTHYHLVTFSIKHNEIIITCDNKEFSTSANESLECAFDSEKLVGYNAKFLIEILNVFDDDTVLSINEQNCFCFKNQNKKGLIAPVKI